MYMRFIAVLLTMSAGFSPSAALPFADSHHDSVPAESAQIHDGDRFEVAVRRPASWLNNSEFKFKLTDLDGNSVAYDDPRFKDKVVLYDIWGTWCPPCREMTPFLKRLHSEYKSKGLVVVGIAFEVERDDGVDPKSRVAQYVSDHNIDYLMLYGGVEEYPSKLVFAELGFREFDGFPTVVIVDKEGNVARIEEDWNTHAAEGIESTIRELLGLPDDDSDA